jgi:hypothetical protein
MSTVIVAYDGKKLLGRCDKTCYDAKGRRCRCICGGRNHGAGEYLAHVHAHQDLPKILRQLDQQTDHQHNIHLYHQSWLLPPKTETS